MDMAGEGHQEAVSPEAIAAAIRAATPVTTSLEKILQEGAQPMGQPPWALLNATPVPQPTHGGYSGHILPGVAFLSLGFWWLLGVVRAHAAATPQRPFVARAWYPVFLDSSSRSRPAGEERREQQQQRRGGGGLLSRIFCCFLCRHSLPLEPCLILALCLLGVNAELWLGHDSFRTLHRDDGYLFQMHLAEWQHVVMYLAFCFSAFVSLAAHLASSSSSSSSPSRPPPLLPRRAPHFALAGAFALEFALFAFHLEGTALDVRAHSLLVVTIGCCALFSAVEALAPENSPVAVEVAAAKSFATWLQGCWFVALAEILFKGRRSMDPRYHGSVMFLPAILGFLALSSGCLWVGAFLVGGAVLRRTKGGGGGGGAVVALSPSRRRHRQVYGRLDDDDDDEGNGDDDDQQKIGAVAVAPKVRLGGGAVLELSAV